MSHKEWINEQQWCEVCSTERNLTNLLLSMLWAESVYVEMQREDSNLKCADLDYLMGPKCWYLLKRIFSQSWSSTVKHQKQLLTQNVTLEFDYGYSMAGVE